MANWRKVYKSDHLGTIDLEDLIAQGKKLIFTVKEVKQEFGAKVAGKKGDFNIAYFVEGIKPLVLNATNARVLRSFSPSGEVETWCNLVVELYIDSNVKAIGGGITEGVRIKPIQPKLEPKKKPYFTNEKFEYCCAQGITVEQIKEVYELSQPIEDAYIDFCASKMEEAE